MRTTILLLMICVAPAGNAQQVYKCVKGKSVSYQSAPCDDKQRTARQWDATPEPESVPSAKEPRKRDAEKHSRDAGTIRVRSGRRSGNASSVSADDSRCNKAKARRQAKLESVGLKRTFSLLRKLDDAVYDACK